MFKSNISPPTISDSIKYKYIIRTEVTKYTVYHTYQDYSYVKHSTLEGAKKACVDHLLKNSNSNPIIFTPSLVAEYKEPPVQFSDVVNYA